MFLAFQARFPTRPLVSSRPPPAPSSTSTARPRDGSLDQAAGLRCGREVVGTPSPFRTLPSTSPIDALHRARPVISENSTDPANLVEDPAATATSGINSLPGTNASSPGPSNLESSSTSARRFRPRTPASARYTRGKTASTTTSRNTGLLADRPVLTTPLSLGPMDDFPADSYVEGSTTPSPKTCQESPSPPPLLGSRTTAGTASFFEYVPSLPRLRASRKNL